MQNKDNSLKSERMKDYMLDRGDTVHATVSHTQVMYLLMWDRGKLWPDFGKLRNSEKQDPLRTGTHHRVDLGIPLAF